MSELSSRAWMFCPRSGDLLVLVPSKGVAECPLCDFTRNIEGDEWPSDSKCVSIVFHCHAWRIYGTSWPRRVLQYSGVPSTLEARVLSRHLHIRSGLDCRS